MRKLPTPHTDTIDKWDTFTDKQKELKIYKDLVHQYIDLIWGVRGYCKRGELYQHIANNFGWNLRGAHVSKYTTVGKCKKVARWAIDILNSGRDIDWAHQGYSEFSYIPIPNEIK